MKIIGKTSEDLGCVSPQDARYKLDIITKRLAAVTKERDELLKDKARLDELEKWECWLKVEGWEYDKRPTFYAGPICPITIRDAADRLIDNAKGVGQ